MTKRLDHTVKRLPDGKTQISVSMPLALTGLEQYDSDNLKTDITVLRRSVTPPRRKIGSAKWFLAQLKRCIQNEAFALMFLEACVGELRSSSFALQKMFNSNPDFVKWYETKQDEMRNDPELRWLIDVRNIAEKEGIIFGEYRHINVVKFYLNGKIEAEISDPTVQIEGREVDNIVFRLEIVLQKLSTLIEDAHALFYGKPERTPIMVQSIYIRETQDGSWERFNYGG